MAISVGTRSVLYGAHCFFIHPFFVALGWWRLYGFPFDYRLWVAFFVHDLGYWGKPNMDGPEGESHVRLGARIMGRLFDSSRSMLWYNFCFLHSRFWSKKFKSGPSQLCYADKLAFSLTPKWLYKLQVYASGEIHEYMEMANTPGSKYSAQRSATFDAWYDKARTFTKEWVYAHYKGERDTWTTLNTLPHRKFCLPKQLLGTGLQTRYKCTSRTPDTT